LGELKQGEVWWVDLGVPFGSEPGYRRPWVVVQNDLTNSTSIRTVIACPLTTSRRLTGAPGNVALSRDEAGLPRPSVVNVSGITALAEGRFEEYLGKVSSQRLREIIAGVNLLVTPTP
jgi:mRNA interferase MazF